MIVYWVCTNCREVIHRLLEGFRGGAHQCVDMNFYALLALRTRREVTEVFAKAAQLQP